MRAATNAIAEVLPIISFSYSHSILDAFGRLGSLIKRMAYLRIWAAKSCIYCRDQCHYFGYDCPPSPYQVRDFPKLSLQGSRVEVLEHSRRANGYGGYVAN